MSHWALKLYTWVTQPNTYDLYVRQHKWHMTTHSHIALRCRNAYKVTTLILLRNCKWNFVNVLLSGNKCFKVHSFSPPWRMVLPCRGSLEEFHRAPTQGYISFSSRDSVPDIYVTIVYIYIYICTRFHSVYCKGIYTLYIRIYIWHIAYIYIEDFQFKGASFPLFDTLTWATFFWKEKTFNIKYSWPFMLVYIY